MSIYGNMLFEKALSTNQRNKLENNIFGIPEERKYPLNDEKHVRSAITYFNKCDPKYEAELAKNINKRIKDLGMTVEVSEDNNFYKYYKGNKK